LVKAVQEEGYRETFINASNASKAAAYWRFWSLHSMWKESMKGPPTTVAWTIKGATGRTNGLQGAWSLNVYAESFNLNKQKGDGDFKMKLFSVAFNLSILNTANHRYALWIHYMKRLTKVHEKGSSYEICMMAG
jgi:hypothetical protein